MRTMYEYLAIIGWGWCGLVAIVLPLLIWRKHRREPRGFEVREVSTTEGDRTAS
jgi:hypothetical protein